jgi:hypothetical protein
MKFLLPPNPHFTVVLILLGEGQGGSVPLVGVKEFTSEVKMPTGQNTIYSVI